MDSVRVHGKEFKLAIPNSQILLAVKQVAYQLNQEYASLEPPLFICVLNGSFMFAADLVREINFQPILSFIKVASYKNDQSTGEIKKLIGLNEEINAKHVIIIEDIIDKGLTVDYIYNQLMTSNPKSLKIASLFFKREAYLGKINIDFIGLEVPNKFLIGYGLDYNGLGRNYKDIYELSE